MLQRPGGGRQQQRPGDQSRPAAQLPILGRRLSRFAGRGNAWSITEIQAVGCGAALLTCTAIRAGQSLAPYTTMVLAAAIRSPN